MNQQTISPGKTNDDPLLNNEETAEYLGVSPRTLEKWRLQSSEGPIYHLIGKRPMYRKSSLEDYIASRTRRSTSDSGPSGGSDGK